MENGSAPVSTSGQEAQAEEAKNAANKDFKGAFQCASVDLCSCNLGPRLYCKGFCTDNAEPFAYYCSLSSILSYCISVRSSCMSQCLHVQMSAQVPL